jgi:ABC-type antimicrobial peptide transport system permease subunit
MSLGADSGKVQRMVLMEGGVLLAIGLVLGVIGSLLATRLIQGLLFGVTPNDPITLVAVATAMVLIGVAACWLPARRAAKVDPLVAMRGQ